ncbi:MAG: MoaD/ThiS family protein [Actinobacteria bacterium]|nr:MoaD/ThiS family protein [Actinomycetota bacterium]
MLVKVKLKVYTVAGLFERGLEMVLAEGATVDDLLRELEAQYQSVLSSRLRNPATGNLHVAVIVNNRFAAASARLRDGDEVAILPPAAGG